MFSQLILSRSSHAEDLGYYGRKRGRIANLPRINKLLFKAHHDGPHLYMSERLTTAIKRYITLVYKHERKTPEFVAEIRSKLLCLHEYNMRVAKVKGKYPKSDKLNEILVQYIKLECELLYSDKENFKKSTDEVRRRIMRLIQIVQHDVTNIAEEPISALADDWPKPKLRTKDALKETLKVFVGVKKECGSEYDLIDAIIIDLVNKLGLLDEINGLKGKSIPFHLDTCLKDPHVSKVRQNLITSDYESDTRNSDNEGEPQSPIFKDCFNFTEKLPMPFSIDTNKRPTVSPSKRQSSSKSTKKPFTHRPIFCTDFIKSESDEETRNSCASSADLAQELWQSGDSAVGVDSNSKNITAIGSTNNDLALEPFGGIPQIENTHHCTNSIGESLTNGFKQSLPANVLRADSPRLVPAKTNSNKPSTSVNVPSIPLNPELVTIEILDDSDDDDYRVHVENRSEGGSKIGETNAKMIDHKPMRLLSPNEIKSEENEENHSPNFPVLQIDDPDGDVLYGNKSAQSTNSSDCVRFDNNSGNKAVDQCELVETEREVEKPTDEIAPTIEIDKEEEVAVVPTSGEISGQEYAKVSELGHNEPENEENDDIQNSAALQHLDKSDQNPSDLQIETKSDLFEVNNITTNLILEEDKLTENLPSTNELEETETKESSEFEEVHEIGENITIQTSPQSEEVAVNIVETENDVRSGETAGLDKSEEIASPVFEKSSTKELEETKSSSEFEKIDEIVENITIQTNPQSGDIAVNIVEAENEGHSGGNADLDKGEEIASPIFEKPSTKELEETKSSSEFEEIDEIGENITIQTDPQSGDVPVNIVEAEIEGHLGENADLDTSEEISSLVLEKPTTNELEVTKSTSEFEEIDELGENITIQTDPQSGHVAINIVEAENEGHSGGNVDLDTREEIASPVLEKPTTKELEETKFISEFEEIDEIGENITIQTDPQSGDVAVKIVEAENEGHSGGSADLDTSDEIASPLFEEHAPDHTKIVTNDEYEQFSCNRLNEACTLQPDTEDFNSCNEGICADVEPEVSSNCMNKECVLQSEIEEFNSGSEGSCADAMPEFPLGYVKEECPLQSKTKEFNSCSEGIYSDAVPESPSGCVTEQCPLQSETEEFNSGSEGICADAVPDKTLPPYEACAIQARNEDLCAAVDAAAELANNEDMCADADAAAEALSRELKISTNSSIATSFDDEGIQSQTSISSISDMSNSTSPVSDIDEKNLAPHGIYEENSAKTDADERASTADGALIDLSNKKDTLCESNPPVDEAPYSDLSQVESQISWSQPLQSDPIDSCEPPTDTPIELLETEPNYEKSDNDYYSMPQFTSQEHGVIQEVEIETVPLHETSYYQKEIGCLDILATIAADQKTLAVKSDTESSISRRRKSKVRFSPRKNVAARKKKMQMVVEQSTRVTRNSASKMQAALEAKKESIELARPSEADDKSTENVSVNTSPTRKKHKDKVNSPRSVKAVDLGSTSPTRKNNKEKTISTESLGEEHKTSKSTRTINKNKPVSTRSSRAEHKRQDVSRENSPSSKTSKSKISSPRSSKVEYKPHDFISTQSSSPTRKNNVYTQDRQVEVNSTSDDSNDSCGRMVIDEGGDNLLSLEASDQKSNSSYEDASLNDDLALLPSDSAKETENKKEEPTIRDDATNSDEHNLKSSKPKKAKQQIGDDGSKVDNNDHKDAKRPDKNNQKSSKQIKVAESSKDAARLHKRVPKNAEQGTVQEPAANEDKTQIEENQYKNSKQMKNELSVDGNKNKDKNSKSRKSEKPAVDDKNSLKNAEHNKNDELVINEVVVKINKNKQRKHKEPIVKDDTTKLVKNSRKKVKQKEVVVLTTDSNEPKREQTAHKNPKESKEVDLPISNDDNAGTTKLDQTSYKNSEQPTNCELVIPSPRSRKQKDPGKSVQIKKVGFNNKDSSLKSPKTPKKRGRPRKIPVIETIEPPPVIPANQVESSHNQDELAFDRHFMDFLEEVKIPKTTDHSIENILNKPPVVTTCKKKRAVCNTPPISDATPSSSVQLTKQDADCQNLTVTSAIQPREGISKALFRSKGARKSYDAPETYDGPEPNSHEKVAPPRKTTILQPPRLRSKSFNFEYVTSHDGEGIIKVVSKNVQSKEGNEVSKVTSELENKQKDIDNRKTTDCDSIDTVEEKLIEVGANFEIISKELSNSQSNCIDLEIKNKLTRSDTKPELDSIKLPITKSDSSMKTKEPSGNLSQLALDQIPLPDEKYSAKRLGKKRLILDHSDNSKRFNFIPLDVTTTKEKQETNKADLPPVQTKLSVVSIGEDTAKGEIVQAESIKLGVDKISPKKALKNKKDKVISLEDTIKKVKQKLSTTEGVNFDPALLKENMDNIEVASSDQFLKNIASGELQVIKLPADGISEENLPELENNEQSPKKSTQDVVIEFTTTLYEKISKFKDDAAMVVVNTITEKPEDDKIKSKSVEGVNDENHLKPDSNIKSKPIEQDAVKSSNDKGNKQFKEEEKKKRRDRSRSRSRSKHEKKKDRRSLSPSKSKSEKSSPYKSKESNRNIRSRSLSKSRSLEDKHERHSSEKSKHSDGRRRSRSPSKSSERKDRHGKYLKSSKDRRNNANLPEESLFSPDKHKREIKSPRDGDHKKRSKSPEAHHHRLRAAEKQKQHVSTAESNSRVTSNDIASRRSKSKEVEALRLEDKPLHKKSPEKVKDTNSGGKSTSKPTLNDLPTKSKETPPETSNEKNTTNGKHTSTKRGLSLLSSSNKSTEKLNTEDKSEHQRLENGPFGKTRGTSKRRRSKSKEKEPDEVCPKKMELRSTCKNMSKSDVKSDFSKEKPVVYQATDKSIKSDKSDSKITEDNKDSQILKYEPVVKRSRSKSSDKTKECSAENKDAQILLTSSDKKDVSENHVKELTKKGNPDSTVTQDKNVAKDESIIDGDSQGHVAKDGPITIEVESKAKCKNSVTQIDLKSTKEKTSKIENNLKKKSDHSESNEKLPKSKKSTVESKNKQEKSEPDAVESSTAKLKEIKTKVNTTESTVVTRDKNGSKKKKEIMIESNSQNIVARDDAIAMIVESEARDNNDSTQTDAKPTTEKTSKIENNLKKKSDHSESNEKLPKSKKSTVESKNKQEKPEPDAVESSTAKLKEIKTKDNTTESTVVTRDKNGSKKKKEIMIESNSQNIVARDDAIAMIVESEARDNSDSTQTDAKPTKEKTSKIENNLKKKSDHSESNEKLPKSKSTVESKNKQEKPEPDAVESSTAKLKEIKTKDNTTESTVVTRDKNGSKKKKEIMIESNCQNIVARDDAIAMVVESEARDNSDSTQIDAKPTSKIENHSTKKSDSESKESVTKSKKSIVDSKNTQEELADSFLEGSMIEVKEIKTKESNTESTVIRDKVLTKNKEIMIGSDSQNDVAKDNTITIVVENKAEDKYDSTQIDLNPTKEKIIIIENNHKKRSNNSESNEKVTKLMGSAAENNNKREQSKNEFLECTLTEKENKAGKKNIEKDADIRVMKEKEIRLENNNSVKVHVAESDLKDVANKNVEEVHNKNYSETTEEKINKIKSKHNFEDAMKVTQAIKSKIEDEGKVGKDSVIEMMDTKEAEIKVVNKLESRDGTENVTVTPIKRNKVDSSNKLDTEDGVSHKPDSVALKVKTTTESRIEEKHKVKTDAESNVLKSKTSKSEDKYKLKGKDNGAESKIKTTNEKEAKTENKRNDKNNGMQCNLKPTTNTKRNNIAHKSKLGVDGNDKHAILEVELDTKSKVENNENQNKCAQSNANVPKAKRTKIEIKSKLETDRTEMSSEPNQVTKVGIEQQTTERDVIVNQTAEITIENKCITENVHRVVESELAVTTEESTVEEYTTGTKTTLIENNAQPIEKKTEIETKCTESATTVTQTVESAVDSTGKAENPSDLTETQAPESIIEDENKSKNENDIGNETTEITVENILHGKESATIKTKNEDQREIVTISDKTESVELAEIRETKIDSKLDAVAEPKNDTVENENKQHSVQNYAIVVQKKTSSVKESLTKNAERDPKLQPHLNVIQDQDKIDKFDNLVPIQEPNNDKNVIDTTLLDEISLPSLTKSSKKRTATEDASEICSSSSKKLKLNTVEEDTDTTVISKQQLVDSAVFSIIENKVINRDVLKQFESTEEDKMFETDIFLTEPTDKSIIDPQLLSKFTTGVPCDLTSAVSQDSFFNDDYIVPKTSAPATVSERRVTTVEVHVMNNLGVEDDRSKSPQLFASLSISPDSKIKTVDVKLLKSLIVEEDGSDKSLDTFSPQPVSLDNAKTCVDIATDTMCNNIILESSQTLLSNNMETYVPKMLELCPSTDVSSESIFVSNTYTSPYTSESLGLQVLPDSLTSVVSHVESSKKMDPLHYDMNIVDISPGKLRIGSSQSLDLISPTSASMNEINLGQNLVPSRLNYIEIEKEPDGDHNYSLGGPLVGGSSNSNSATNNDNKSMFATESTLSPTDSPEEFSLNDFSLNMMDDGEELGDFYPLSCKKEKSEDFDTNRYSVMGVNDDMCKSHSSQSNGPDLLSDISQSDDQSETNVNSLELANAEVVKMLISMGNSGTPESSSYSTLTDIADINIEKIELLEMNKDDSTLDDSRDKLDDVPSDDICSSGLPTISFDKVRKDISSTMQSNAESEDKKSSSNTKVKDDATQYKFSKFLESLKETESIKPSTLTDKKKYTANLVKDCKETKSSSPAWKNDNDDGGRENMKNLTCISETSKDNSSLEISRDKWDNSKPNDVLKNREQKVVVELIEPCPLTEILLGDVNHSAKNQNDHRHFSTKNTKSTTRATKILEALKKTEPDKNNFSTRAEKDGGYLMRRNNRTKVAPPKPKNAHQKSKPTDKEDKKKVENKDNINNHSSTYNRIRVKKEELLLRTDYIQEDDLNIAHRVTVPYLLSPAQLEMPTLAKSPRVESNIIDKNEVKQTDDDQKNKRKRKLSKQPDSDADEPKFKSRSEYFEAEFDRLKKQDEDEKRNKLRQQTTPKDSYKTTSKRENGFYDSSLKDKHSGHRSDSRSREDLRYSHRDHDWRHRRPGSSQSSYNSSVERKRDEKKPHTDPIISRASPRQPYLRYQDKSSSRNCFKNDNAEGQNDWLQKFSEKIGPDFVGTTANLFQLPESKSKSTPSQLP